MKDNDTKRLASLRRALEIRSKAYLSIHIFFQDRGYTHVETPVRLKAPALETHIDAEPSGSMFLRTSPELHMKRMLVAGYERLYQIGPCFRRGELGEKHHPEYTMLEWYQTGADYMDILEETKGLLCALSDDSRLKEWETITVSDAFQQWAGWDPAGNYDAERFEVDLVDKVEPALPRDKAVVLIDYPAEAAAFSRLKPGNPNVAERWELYLNGIEIANAYSELVDAAEQERRFAASAEERREMEKPVYPIDNDFMEAMKQGLPECAGIALGFDRLVMILSDASTLDDVIAFREEEDSGRK